MKKYVYLVIFLLGFANTSFAEKGINMGLSLQAGVFETSALEKEDDETSASKSAEGLFAIGSIFVEKVLPNEKVSFGIDYVPYALESETSNHEQEDIQAGELESGKSTVDQKVQVDFENLLTVYAKLNFTDNVYLKAGYMQVEAVTNESLGTGASYGDKTLDGMTVGLGYELDMDNGAFVRLEGNWMELGGETFTATGTDTGDLSVVVDDIDGYGARVSIGRSF
tara:strand:- start:912 stop:1583 length:672 start_codon:yes stop_codon:yes gene_type:complete